MPLAVPRGDGDAIETIYIRHQNWILGISDIDLIMLYRGSGPDGERGMFTGFWHRYRRLRWLFPMLCGVSEIRWIPLERLDRHPLQRQPETRLLLNPEQWLPVYSRAGGKKAGPVFDPPEGRAPPFTMFLDFNVYGYLQKQLFADERQPALRVERMAKCAVKALQHLHHLERGEYVTVRALQRRLDEPRGEHPWKRYAALLGGLVSPPADERQRDRAIARSVYDLLLELDRAHAPLLDGTEPRHDCPHRTPAPWGGTALGRFLSEAEARFGRSPGLVGFRSPYKQYQARLFVLLTPELPFEAFYDFLQFARGHQHALQAENAVLAASTPALLSSQFRNLWGHVALEAYILQAQPVHAPAGGLGLYRPEEAWTLQKIRESVAVFEEFYLPFLMAPEARGSGMDFCKIYERAETEMLFHYYCYLRDPDDWFEVLRDSGGSVDEVIAHGCARYGNEIGIQDWHPFRFIDSYPYLKRLIRLIDRLALEKLELLSSPAQSST